MPNARLAGVSVMLGSVPLPESEMLCGLPLALSLMEMVAERAPAAAGTNVALMAHWPPAAKVLGERGQVVVSEKSPGLAPTRPMLKMVSGPVPEFVSVTVCKTELVPTFWLPKVRLVEESETIGTTAVRVVEPQMEPSQAVIMDEPPMREKAVP